MTATNPLIRTASRRAFAAGLAALLALAGCKSTKDGNSATKSRDPLVHGPTRIPPQNVPIPGRGDTGIGAKGTKSDPLLERPVGRGGTGVGYSDDSERFKGTFTPGPGSTPASLAGKGKDPDELRIDTPDNRVPLRPAGGVLPAGGVGGAGGAEPLAVDNGEVERLYADLAKYGVLPGDRNLVRENGGYTFRASVQISGNGAKREYSGVGPTAAEAVRSVLDQVVAERK